VILLEPHQLILPDGQITSCFPKWLVQPLLQKYFPSRLTQITSISITVPSLRGALRNVINAGRDAVDAGGAFDNGADAYGQVVSFWRPNAGVKSAIRSAGDGVKQAWSPGRARSKP
jgi:hypothetical protein